MYIRTIMGSIYKVDNNKYGVIEENGIFKKYCENMGHSWYSELVATNQSENLEELCDQIVYGGYLYKNKITWDNCIVEDSFEELDEPITDEMINEGIYGAIWTDKGLIYVAKMDSEGKLVLI